MKNGDSESSSANPEIPPRQPVGAGTGTARYKVQKSSGQGKSSSSCQPRLPVSPCNSADGGLQLGSSLDLLNIELSQDSYWQEPPGGGGRGETIADDTLSPSE